MAQTALHGGRGSGPYPPGGTPLGLDLAAKHDRTATTQTRRAAGRGAVSMNDKTTSLLDLALKPVESGVSTIPIFGKGGGFLWKQYQDRLPTEHELRRAFKQNGRGAPTGLAAIFCEATWAAFPYLCMLEIEARHRAIAEPWLDEHLPG